MRQRFLMCGRNRIRHLQTVLLTVSLLAIGSLLPSRATAGPTDWLIQGGNAVRRQLGTDQPRYVRRSIEVENASLETLKRRLGWFGIIIPLQLEGDVTARLGVELNVAALRDAKSYRINGSLQSRRIVVEGLDLRNLNATVRYVDGRLTLDQLSVTVPDPRPNQPAGRAVGSATLDLAPAGPLNATLQLTGVPLEPFSRRIAAAASLTGGRLDGNVNLIAPQSTIRDITTWTGRGRLEISNLIAAGRNVETATTEFRLDRGTLTVSSISALIEQERITGSGRLGLTAPYDYQIQLAVPDGELSRLPRLAARPLPGKFRGSYSLTAQANGTLQPFTMNAKGALTGTDWIVAGLPVESFAADVTTDGKLIHLDGLNIALLNGTARGTGQIATSAPYAYQAQLTLADLNLAGTAALPAELRPPVPLAGALNGNLTADGEAGTGKLTSDINLTLNEPRLGDATFDLARLVGKVTDRTVDLNTIELISGDSRLAGSLNLSLDAPNDFKADLQAVRFDLGKLAPLLAALRAPAPTAGQTAPPAMGGNAATTEDAAAAALIGGVMNGQLAVAGAASPFELESLNGRFTIDRPLLAGVRFDSAEFQATTQGRTLNLSTFRLTIGDGRISGNATVGLDAPHNFQGDLTTRDFPISALQPLFGPNGIISRTLPPLRGELVSDIAIKGAASPFRLDSLNASIASDNLQIGDLVVDRLSIKAISDGQTANLSELLIRLDEGRISGSATISLQNANPFTANLALVNFNLDSLNPLLKVADRENLPPISGPLNGQLSAQGEASPFQLTALDAHLSGDRLRIGELIIDRLAVNVVTDQQTAKLTELLIQLGEGRTSGNATIGLQNANPFTANLSLVNFNLDSLNPLLKFADRENLPPISGPLNGQLSAQGKGSPFELDALDANLTGDQLKVGDLTVDRLAVKINSDGNTVNLSELLIQLADNQGRISGNATVTLNEAQPFDASLRLDELQLAALRPLFSPTGLFPTAQVPPGGLLDGQLDIAGRIEPLQLTNIAGQFTAANFVVSNVAIEQAKVVVTTENGVARITGFSARTAFALAQGTGTISLAAPFNYTADLTIDDIRLDSLGDLTAALTATQQPDVDTPAEAAPGPGILPVELEGFVELSADLKGTLSPWLIEATGRGESESVIVDATELTALVKTTELTGVSFRFGYGKNGLTLDDVAATAADGSLKASFTMPLADEATGHLNLNLDSVQLQTLLPLPAGIAATGSADVRVIFGPKQENGDRPLSAEVTASLPQITLRGGNAGSLKTTLTLKQGLLTYNVEGSVIGGVIEGKGTYPVSAPANAGAGALAVRGADLSRISVLGGNSVPRLGGSLNAEINYTVPIADGMPGQPQMAGQPQVNGFLEVLNVRSDGQLITNRLRARVLYQNSRLLIDNAGGSFAGGTVSLDVEVNPANLRSGSVEVVLRRVDAARLATFVPGAADQITGTLNLRIRGRLGELWHWQGDGELIRGSVAGFELSEWRFPIDLDANPNRGAIRVRLPRTTLRAAGGRGTLTITILQGNTTQLEIDASFVNLGADDVLGSLGKRIPGGRITGSVNLSSRNFRGIADLNGSISAKIRGGEPGNLPVVGSAIELVKLPIGGNAIDHGDFRASLRNGLARVEHLTLAGNAFRIYAEGSIALASERLQINMVIDTAPQRQDRLIAAILLRQALVYATPFGWLERANRLIAERALFLRITGTIRRPIVRIRAVEQLQQEAIRFFLGELAAPAAPAAAP